MVKKTTTEMTLIAELRLKRPELAARAAGGSVLSAVRLNCLECVGGSVVEAARCVSADCALYPYRLGRNPFRAARVLTDEQRQQAADRLKAAREKRSAGEAFLIAARKILRSAREDAGVHLGDAAAAAGIEVVLLSDIELEQAPLTAEILDALTEFYDGQANDGEDDREEDVDE